MELLTVNWWRSCRTCSITSHIPQVFLFPFWARAFLHALFILQVAWRDRRWLHLKWSQQDCTLASPRWGGGVTLKPAPGSTSSSLRSGPNVRDSGRVISCLTYSYSNGHISLTLLWHRDFHVYVQRLHPLTDLEPQDLLDTRTHQICSVANTKIASICRFLGFCSMDTGKLGQLQDTPKPLQACVTQ